MKPKNNRRAPGLGWLLALILFMVAGGIIAGGFFYHRNFETHYRAEVERQISTIADLKVGELTRWRKERLGDGAMMFRNRAFSDLVRRYFENSADAHVKQDLRSWIDRLPEGYGYDRIRLLDMQGNLRMAWPAEKFSALPMKLVEEIPLVIQSGQIKFFDFYRDEYDQHVYLTMMIPIFEEMDDTKVIGVLALRIDPERFLYPFIQSWPTPSQSAETLLVRREGSNVLFLNELRFLTNAALRLRSPLSQTSLPGVQAVLGQEGVFTGRDYRDVPVMAALRTIPDSPWALVAKMDQAEVYAPVREQLRQVVILVVTLLFVAGSSVAVIWRHQRARHYREQVVVLKALDREQKLVVHLMENLPDYIYFKDAAGKFLRANPALINLYRLKNPLEIVGKTDADFLPAARAQETAAQEQEIMRTGQPVVEIEEKTVWADGGETWVMSTKLPLRDDAGCIIGISGISSDITERKLAELALEQKNLELERVLYSASHDLKSPVVTVCTFLGYLEKDMQTGNAERVAKDMNFIRTAAEKMGRLLDELLVVSRVGRAVNAPVTVTFHSLVKDAL
ncbi:MAG: PAS domain-containing protein, partial [Verrucomicrobiota bacterium]